MHASSVVAAVTVIVIVVHIGVVHAHDEKR